MCHVRENQAGRLMTLAHGQTIAQHVDPIEKKPLFHFLPGSAAYSIATQGCNFHCDYCTNWHVSQVSGGASEYLQPESVPEQIVTSALEAQCQHLAYTYVEPTIFFEYLQEVATLGHQAKLLNVWKTNGFMTPEVLTNCQPLMQAANVDLKTFRERTYREFGGRLTPVLDAIHHMQALGIWIEITTVIIPGINDSRDELIEMAEFLAKDVSVDTPWHLTRFFPAYRMSHIPPTPLETLHQAYEIGREAGLNYVYLGNVLARETQDTVCPQCHTTVILRRGSQLVENSLKAGKCPQCETKIPGIWKSDQA